MQLNKINKKSQAEMITTVLLIILSIAAVIIVWNIIYSLLNKGVQEVGIEGMLVDGELEYYIPDNFAVVKIKRGNDNINISGIKILFTDINGANYIYNTTDYPGLLETKRYIISLNQLIPEVGVWTFAKVASISFVYLFPNNKMSFEIDKQNINKETNMSQGFDERCLYNDTDGDGYGTGTCTQYYSASNGKTPLTGDCNDANISINPGVSEICDDGVDNDCDGQSDEACPNYVVTSTADIPTQWISDINCTWNDVTFDPTTLAAAITSDFDIYFYGQSQGKTIYMCKTGHLVFNEGDCYKLTSNPSTTTLSSIKTIAPFLIKAGSILGKNCKYNGKLVFRWIKGTSESEAIIDNDGNMNFWYNEISILREVGVSLGNGKYIEIQQYGQTNNQDKNHLLEYK